MRGRWDLSYAQWKLIEPILRPQRRADGRGRPWQDTRAVLNGILWVLGTRAQWRELPQKYPPYQTCHRRFQQWVRAGKLERVLRVLARELQARGKLDVEGHSSTPPSQGKKGGLAVGPTKRGKGTKILALAMITVFLSLLVSKALRRTKASSSRGCASSKPPALVK